MNNKIVITIALLLMAGSAPAMQQQQQQRQEQEPQQQVQKKKDKKKQHQNNNGGDAGSDTAPVDPDIADLAADMAAIVHTITQEHGSVAGMLTHLKHKEHQRICPTCGLPAEQCGVDRDRIAHGNIMLCGCPLCGGLKI